MKDNIFNKIKKNVDESSPFMLREDSDVRTITCPNCKAPRPVRTDLTTCDYCGYTFMPIDQYIKADNQDGK